MQLRSISYLVTLCSILFSTAHAGLNPPTILARHAGGVDYPSVVVNDDNDGIAIWLASTISSGRLIQTATITSGSWNPIINLTDGSTYTDAPQVVINNSGHVMAIWTEWTGSDYLTKAIFYDGKQWQTAQTISSAGSPSLTPQISMNANGDAIVVWQLNSDLGTAVQAACYLQGKWSAPIILSSYSNAQTPHIALSDSGHALAVWSAYLPTGNAIYAASYYNNVWSTETPISQLGNQSSSPRVAITNSGTGIAIWETTNTSGFNVIQAANYTPQTSWASPQNLSDGSDNGFNPSIAMNNHGHAVATWLFHYDAPTYQIHASQFFKKTWSSPQIISNQQETNMNALVFMNDNDQAIAIWISDRSIASAPFSLQEWGDPLLISTEGETCYFPSAAITKTNNIYTIWGSVGYTIQSSTGG